MLNLVLYNHRIVYPKVCDNDGTVHDLIPSLSRLRNYSYSSKLIVDILKTTSICLDEKCVSTDTKLISEKIIGKVPIMVNSKFCLNTQLIYRQVL